jgi:hypothetical protein
LTRKLSFVRFRAPLSEYLEDIDPQVSP